MTVPFTSNSYLGLLLPPSMMTILREPKGTEGLFSAGAGPFGNIIVMRELGSWGMGKERLDPK